jgi:hypothetical protein
MPPAGVPITMHVSTMHGQTGITATITRVSAPLNLAGMAASSANSTNAAAASAASGSTSSAPPAGGPQPEMPAFLGVLVEQIMRSMAASGALNQPPPTRKASPEALDALPVVTVKEELCDQDCPVCQDCFTEGEKVVRMPCGHSFHRPCLQPWMQSHNTCPTCRYELDTTDESYNQQLQEGRAKKIDVREERVMRETKYV